MTSTKSRIVSEKERKERRRASNRRSARKSRYRENVLVDELHKTMASLKTCNETLKAENESFRKHVALLRNLIMEKPADLVGWVVSYKDKKKENLQ